MNERKALALISGGLDSTLATALVNRQENITVIGYHFRHPFAPPLGNDGLLPAERAAFQIGIPIIVDSDDQAFIEMVKHPEHGIGKGVNPCRDCRIFILRKAAEMLKRIGGDFIVTGEVPGQRPMTQTKPYMNFIEKRSGLSGLILRPLCAKNLALSIPEKKGWVSRNDPLAFSGRGRKSQMALAEKLGIDNYPQPAGGCILTKKEFSRRFRDLIDHNPDTDLTDIKSLEIGRHFRLPNNLKIIIARDESECNWIIGNLKNTYWLAEVKEIPGPLAAIIRQPTPKELATIASLVSSYGKASKMPSVRVAFYSPSGEELFIETQPGDKAKFAEYLL